MKVLFYHSSMQSGGAERTISLLSNYLAAAGDEVNVVTMDNQPSFYALHSNVNYITLNTAQVSAGKVDAIKNNFLAIHAVKATFSSINPDVVVCFQPNTLLFSRLVRGKMNYRIIGSERANPYLWNQGFWNKTKRFISLCADGYIFQTAGAKSYYPRKTQNKSILLGNMLQTEDFATAEIPWSEKKNICAAGRMDTGKCFSDLLLALSVVVKRHPDAHLDLYGDGPLRNDLQTLCIDLGLQESVTFWGRCDQIITEYAKHKIFVMTSEAEGMPNVLMEAMASGCACVATDCAFGPSELIRSGKNGFLVPVHDVTAIADRICNLLEDDSLCRKLGVAAQEIRYARGVKQIGAHFKDYIIASH